MIRAIIFDFGNVICRFDNKIALKRIAGDTGKSTGELEKRVYQDSSMTADYERGMISSDEFFSRFAATCELRMTKDEFIEAYTDKFTPIPETFELIRGLKGRYQLGLLSNTSEWDFEQGIKTTDVFPLFDSVTLSFQVHSLKPEKEIYRDSLAKLGVEPRECVYIDDIERYFEVACELGMNGIHYRSPQQVLEALKIMNIL